MSCGHCRSFEWDQDELVKSAGFDRDSTDRLMLAQAVHPPEEKQFVWARKSKVGSHDVNVFGPEGYILTVPINILVLVSI